MTVEAAHPDVDLLLDRLHGLACCGCQDCGSPHMDGGRREDGKFWLSVVLPDGYKIEYLGESIDSAAWKVGRALTDHEPGSGEATSTPKS